LTNFDHFPSFRQIQVYLEEVAEKHNDWVQLSVEGWTQEGRPLYLLQLGKLEEGASSSDRRYVYIDAGIHAREWIAPTTALYTIHSLLQLWVTNSPDVRTNVTYLIMPLLNPDGYEYSRTHQRLWRKNRRRPTSDNQCFGVDLNRNFDVIGFGVGASNQSCSDSYSGPFAASEPEVKAAAGVVMRHRNNIRVSLSLHSYGQKWLTSWGFTTQPAMDNDKLIDLGRRASEAMKSVNGREYEVEAAGAMYPAGGASDDFAKAQAFIPYSVTVELPPDKKQVPNDGFQIHPSQIRGVGQEFWQALVPVALAASREPLGPDPSAMQELQRSNWPFIR